MKLIAPFHLGLDRQGKLYETSGKAFDAPAYSRMKYGVRSDLKRFAHWLADELQRAAPELFTAAQPPAMLTSYKAAAPPATTLARYCLDGINLVRFQKGLAPGEMVQVYRPRDYIEEYAILPAEERKKMLGSQADNSLRGRSLAGFTPVILDDIHVTGTYTAMMQRALQGYDPIVTAYLIVCDKSLQAAPHAEGMLNSAAIREPADLLPFIEHGDFVFTRRFLKMLLRTPPAKLETVIAQLPSALLEQIARGIIDTDSQLQHIFPKTCRLILDAAKTRSIFSLL